MQNRNINFRSTTDTHTDIDFGSHLENIPAPLFDEDICFCFVIEEEKREKIKVVAAKLSGSFNEKLTGDKTLDKRIQFISDFFDKIYGKTIASYFIEINEKERQITDLTEKYNSLVTPYKNLFIKTEHNFSVINQALPLVNNAMLKNEAEVDKKDHIHTLFFSIKSRMSGRIRKHELDNDPSTNNIIKRQ